MTIRLHPFAQAELSRRPSDWVTSVLAGADPSAVASERVDIVERVAKGGYPAVQGLSPRLRVAWLRDYANAQSGMRRHRARPGPGTASSAGDDVRSPDAGTGLRAPGTGTRARTGHCSATPGNLEALFLVERLPSCHATSRNGRSSGGKAFLTDSAPAVALSGMSAEHLNSPAGTDHWAPSGELRRQRAPEAAGLVCHRLHLVPLPGSAWRRGGSDRRDPTRGPGGRG